MSNQKWNISANNILTCAVYAVIGLMLIIMKSGALDILMTVIGVLLVVLGIMDIIKGKNPVKGLTEIVLGIAVGVCGWVITDFVLLVFGIVLIVKGIIEVLNNLQAKNNNMLSPLVTIVIGVLLVVAKWALMDVMCIVAGVIFLLDAVCVLFGKPRVR